MLTTLNARKLYLIGNDHRRLAFSLITLVLISLTLLLSVRGLGAVWGVPFIIWYDDCGLLLLVVGAILLFYGVCWDVLVFLTFLSSKVISKIKAGHKYTQLHILYRHLGFFSVGIVPILVVLFTSYVILETSNITIVSLKLSGSLIPWRDAFFWDIEKGVYYFLANYRPNPSFWDILYNSAWAIELFAIFLLVLTSRNQVLVAKFCVSFVLLFYIGRLVGLLSPVKGPAFFRPELFSYLEGTFSLRAMLEINPIIVSDPSVLKSGILVGGVSAMPSLHIGMVFLTAYWLSSGLRYFRYITPVWVVSVWISTVLLGWHYILDGVGGLMLGILCILLNKHLFKPIES